MLSKNQVSKLLRLNLPPWLDDDEREEVLSEASEYLLTEVLDYVAQGISPVTGKPFNDLTKAYAEAQKGGDTTANLDLNGDMMRALESNVNADGINIGIFDEDQAIKAYGHITGFKGHPWLDGKVKPRKLLPGNGETFHKDIMMGIKELIEDYADERKDNEEAQTS